MKNYFPFTDYDFYGYFVSGIGLLVALDYTITGGENISRENWPFLHVVFAVALAYVVGQVLASLASLAIEHWLARYVLFTPAAVLLGFATPRRREKLVAFLVGRYYGPLPLGVRKSILDRASAALGLGPQDNALDPEAVFQVAFALARTNDDTSKRLDDFRNQYGLCRNVACAAFIASAAFATSAWMREMPESWLWSAFALTLAFGMLVRFFKFYGAFTGEALRALVLTKTE